MESDVRLRRVAVAFNSGQTMLECCKSAGLAVAFIRLAYNDRVLGDYGCSHSTH